MAYGPAAGAGMTVGTTVAGAVAGLCVSWKIVMVGADMLEIVAFTFCQ